MEAKKPNTTISGKKSIASDNLPDRFVLALALALTEFEDASRSQGYLLLQEGCGYGVVRPAHLGEGEQESECRFGALVLVDPVNMQAVPAATALSIIEG